MRSTKYLVGITAICATGILAAACSSGSKSKTYTLATGDYSLVPSGVTADTCFPTSVESLLTAGIQLPFHLDATSDTTFTLTPDTTGTVGQAVGAILPPLDGTKDGNALSLTATGHYFLTSSCSLGFSTNPAATGKMTADNQFDVSIPLQIQAVTTNGSTAVCPAVVQSAFVQGTGTLVPWPTLDGTNHESGKCSLTIAGTVSE